jgi:hypothetical protein
MKVLISVTRSTRYTSIVEMSAAEYKRLCKGLDNGERRIEEEINSLINVNDWQDDSLDDIDQFEVYKPKP